MLNPFPIQFLALLAYFILRVFIGLILIWLGWQHYRHRHDIRTTLFTAGQRFSHTKTWLLLTAEFGIATFILLGAFTQYAALALMVYAVTFLFLRSTLQRPETPSRTFFVLLLGCAITLFITGAGALAFDLPI